MTKKHVHEFFPQMSGDEEETEGCDCGEVRLIKAKPTIRDTAAYKELDSYLAVGRAEGFEPAETEEQVIAAWQYIKDKGLWRNLQGFFGRTVANLTEEGILI